MQDKTNIFILSYIVQNHTDKKEIDIYKLIRDYSKFLYLYESLTIGEQNE